MGCETTPLDSERDEKLPAARIDPTTKFQMQSLIFFYFVFIFRLSSTQSTIRHLLFLGILQITQISAKTCITKQTRKKIYVWKKN